MSISIFDHIREELQERIDDFSQDVKVAHLDLLLSYSNRFYERQFVTRQTASHTEADFSGNFSKDKLKGYFAFVFQSEKIVEAKANLL